MRLNNLWILLLSLAATTFPSALATASGELALVIELPSYETFLKNVGDAPITMDAYSITSISESLDLAGWFPLSDVPVQDLTAAFGPNVTDFYTLSSSIPTSDLSEICIGGFALFQPGQSWSIGYPIDFESPSFVPDMEFGYLNSQGEVSNAQVIFVPVPEPQTACLLLASAALISLKFLYHPSRR